MQIVRTTQQLGPARVCLAIGVFDGVHLGHQQVIRQTFADAGQREARSVVVTFDRHPNAVVAPDRLPLMIQTLPQRLRGIEALGVDATLILEFTPELSRVPAEEFIRGLARELGSVLSVCVGRNFTFGHRRGGNVELLKSLGIECGFQVHGLAALALGGIPVSSTRVREAVLHGQLDLASQMLGRPFTLCGRVVPGDKLGRQLGFPTANLDVAGLVLPPGGVYAVQATSYKLEPRGSKPIRACRGLLNIGTRPTLREPSPELRAEVHLLNYKGDLYGQELELTLVTKLRDERKFLSLDALKEQIQLDIRSARNLFEPRSGGDQD